MIGDFLGRTTTIVSGGRPFICRRATVGAVLRALDLFADYIAAGLTVEAKVDPVDLIVQTARTEPQRSAYVLESCVDGSPGSVIAACIDNKELVATLTAGVLSVTNLKRITDALDLSAANSVEDESAGPSPLELSIVQLAQLFSKTPEQITDWPFEMFLGVQDCLNDSGEEKDEFMQLVEKAQRERVQA